MVDYVKVNLKAGKGGDGAVSFQTNKHKSKGPPDGGDGGAGGDVVLVVDKDQTTLLAFRYRKDFKADPGMRGGKNNKRGARGGDLVLPVPAGTRVTDEKGRLFADLTSVGERVLVAKGGHGGRGNSHIKMSDVRSKSEEFDKSGFKDVWHWFEKGEAGQEIALTLELKILADVGLIGLPNAGKSTLLSQLTAAKPKIASYPFTTLEPNLGVMHTKAKEIVIADIPGLIEGASLGKGLGGIFLRHIERTRLLVHLVSVESADPVKDVETINKELSEYSELLNDKPQVVVLNKIDIVSEKEIQNKLDQFKKNRVKTIQLSAATGVGLEALKDEILKRLG